MDFELGEVVAEREVRFTPEPSVVHLGGASTATVRTEMSVELFISVMRFARRHYSGFHCLALLWLWRTIMLVRLVRDHLRLACGGGDPAQSRQLRSDVAAWRRALLWKFGDLQTRPQD